MADPIDDCRRVKRSAGVGKPDVLAERVDAGVAERLAPERQAVDGAALFAKLDQLAVAGARGFRVGAVPAGGGLIAVAVFDTAADAKAFLTRFCTRAVPTLWHVGQVVELTVGGFDRYDIETQAELSRLARGRWFVACDASPSGLRDATEPPPRRAVAGARRAERRRQERGA
jgi:hypothetical protein